MPWPLLMANWLMDPIATSVTGSLQFKKPYPVQGSWHKEMVSNAYPMAAMRHAAESAKHLNKPKDRWSDDDRQFFIKQMSESQDE